MRRVISIIIFAFVVINIVGLTVFLVGNSQGSNNTPPPAQGEQQNNTGSGVDSGGETLKISLEDLKKHNLKSDCWVGYKGKVYDLTSWLPEHPGSALAITPFCGTAEEFENAFTGQHGTSQVERLIAESIYKGELQ